MDKIPKKAFNWKNKNQDNLDNISEKEFEEFDKLS